MKIKNLVFKDKESIKPIIDSVLELNKSGRKNRSKK